MTRRVDWAVLAMAGKGRDWDFSDGGDAEEAVREHLGQNPEEWYPRSFIALALDMDQRKLENVLWRLARKGDVEVRRENGYIHWRGGVGAS